MEIERCPEMAQQRETEAVRVTEIIIDLIGSRLGSKHA